MIRILLPLVLFIALIVFLAIGLKKDPRLVPSPLIGKSIPEFTLPILHQANASMSNKDFVGRVVLLNVWASWCVSCRHEHPFLMELAKSNAVPIYGLNYKDAREDALRWLDRFGNPYVQSLHDLDGRVGIDFGVYGAPETFVIDKQGRVAAKHVGVVTAEVWRETLLPLIQTLSKEDMSNTGL